MNSQNQPGQSKAQRAAAAREKARQVREAEASRRKRNTWLIRGGIIVAVLASIAVVAGITIANTRNNAPIADSGPVPANVNTYAGVTVGKDDKVIPPENMVNAVDSSTLGPMPTTAAPQPFGLAEIGIQAAPADQPVQVVAYTDFICPACNVFEQANASMLKELADQGLITYEYRPAGLLDSKTTSNYSSRSAAAAACVADSAPDSYLTFFGSLFENQPQENGAGLSNDQLKQYAREAGANIDSCVDERTYRPIVQYATQQALAHGVTATPIVFVDGQQYTSQAPSFSDFRQFVQAAIDAKNA
ncbi:DsbA family protein [Acaricomes phytoseiuli]|uniref:DsbA family protein n=1 Tax=Acaricomes phytoseiuli TaxID=291968 RepID=UPI00035ED380|nr:thioredoxin domain-containing protein [Acaricomes phytoseiuli]MCW1250205.1 DsbA family protein [Acaricomes phytoseiuli]